MNGVLGFLSFFCFLSRTGPGAACENEPFSCSLPTDSGSSIDLSVERDVERANTYNRNIPRETLQVQCVGSHEHINPN